MAGAADESPRERVARARAGDEAAREELAHWCRRTAYLLALQLLRNPDDALDVAQDAVLRFFTHLHRFDTDRAVKPWLFAIVRNRVRDMKRWSRVRHHEPMEGLSGEDRPDIIDRRPGPETSAQRRELQAKLWHAIEGLPPAQREILVLRDYQDLTYAEIAKALAIPQGTVMSRLHRARQALRRILEASGAFGDL